MVLGVNSPSQQPAIVATCIVSPIISSFFVTVRLWTRASITRNLSWDDCRLTLSSLFWWLYFLHIADTALATWVSIRGGWVRDRIAYKTTL